MGPSGIPLSFRSNPLARALARAAEPASRSRRVCLLLAGVLVMSLADLDMTLAYARSVGLMEENPLARLVMTYGSAWVLALWKIASVGLCLFILYKARRTRYAEIAAWICFAVLVWLSVRWTTYNNEMPLLTNYLSSRENSGDHRWVTLGDEDAPLRAH